MFVLNVKKLMCYFFILGCLLAMSACGGSGGGGIDGTGGVKSTITAKGSIDGFGSIVMNGVTYTTDSALFFVDDKPVAESELAIGQVVRLDGLINEDNRTGKADRVVSFSNVIGPVKSIDVIEARFSVLGQTILLDEQTVLEGLDDIAYLQAGQLLKVSGFVDSKQQVLATRIDLLASVENQQVFGKISEIDTGSKQFSINNIIVDYNNLSSAPSLALGDIVKVNGTQNSQELFIANSIKPISESFDSEKALIDLEGLITSVTDQNRFSIGGTEVLSDANTQYENGSINDISLNARIQVKASFNEAGVLVADTVIIIHSGPVVIQGSIKKGETLTYQMMSTDMDIGIWSSLKKVSETDGHNILSFSVSSSSVAAVTPECISWIGVDNTRHCYAGNSQATTWYLRVTYPESAQTSNTIYFELDSYFRRLPIAEPVLVTEREKIEESLFDGDRRVYRLPAGESGSFSVITINSSKKDFFLYAKADEYPIRTRWNRPCYIQGAFVGEKVCRLSNDGVTDWYIILEAAGQISYSIDVEQITPTTLTNNVSIDGNIKTTAGNFYQLDTEADAATLTTLLSHLSKSVNMSVTKNIDDQRYRCVTRLYNESDRQCTIQNEGANRWYFVIKGEIGANYRLRAFTQNKFPKIKEIMSGESDIRTHDAGERSIYKIPRGPVDTVLTATLSDATASFDLHVNADEVKSPYVSDCYHSDLTISNKECRSLNKQTIQDWYVVVEGAFAGSYTLNLDYQKLYELKQGIEVSETIDTENGVLYRMAADDSVDSFRFETSNHSAPVDVIIAQGHPPYAKETSCKSYQTPGGVCELNSQIYDGSHPDWYVLILGELGSSFTLKAIAR